MKIANKTFGAIVALACLCSGMLHGDVRSSTTNLVLEKFVPPIFPLVLKGRGVVDGDMNVLFEIDEKGKVSDWLVLRASHPEFINSVNRVVDRWQFVPILEDGEPQKVIKEVVLSFRLEGAIVNMDIGSFVTNNILRDRFGLTDQNEYRVSELSELDRIPRPVEMVKPEIPRIGDVPETTRATIEFFIDETGQIRFPRVVRSDAPDLYLGQAYLALKKWRFEAPVRGGRPVVARAVQPFVFDNRQ
ncbi:MAG: energy transducer TonB [Opitutales bacterium]|nr:energy transducer TonB [Opitutales bacterium]